MFERNLKFWLSIWSLTITNSNYERTSKKNKRQKPYRYIFFSFQDFFEIMAPNYREEEIAQNLNNIFAEDNKNVTISNIKSPTGDFTREIIIAALKESGFNLGKITKVTEYRAVVRFSNLGVPIVVGCLFLFLSSFLKPLLTTALE